MASCIGIEKTNKSLHPLWDGGSLARGGGWKKVADARL